MRIDADAHVDENEETWADLQAMGRQYEPVRIEAANGRLECRIRQPIVGKVLQPNLATGHSPVLLVDDVDQPQLLKTSTVDRRCCGPQTTGMDRA